MSTATTMVGVMAHRPPSKRGGGPKRGGERSTTRNTVVRGILALAAIAFGSLGIAHSFGQAIASRDPFLAHIVAPFDGRITALFASSLSSVDAPEGLRREADGAARLALEQDATVASAASSLGMNAQARGDLVAARRAFAYSTFLSRRDLTAQLWSIEDAVTRADVVAAIEHYDVALRINLHAAAALFPVLNAAAEEPGVQRELIKTLRSKPAWAEGFIDYLANNSSDPAHGSEFIMTLRSGGAPVSNNADAAIIRRLIAQGNPEIIWRYYSSIRPQEKRTMSRDPTFRARYNVPSPLDWIVGDAVGLSASLGSRGNEGAVEFSISSGFSGAIVSQYELFPEGSYRIIGRSPSISGDPSNAPYWALTCQNGREIGRAAIRQSGASKMGFTGVFLVPNGCPVQILTLMAPRTDVGVTVTGQVNYVLVRPAT